MECPEGKSTHVHKNGHKKGKQNYLDVNYKMQFIDSYEAQKKSVKKVKQQRLLMYVNAIDFERLRKLQASIIQ